MSLLLCRQETVKKPHLVEFLGIHLYSLAELCYVIYRNPVLVMEDFLDEELLTFLREELNLGFLALKLERWLKSGENPDETLIMILQECDYYNASEISRYRQQLAALRKLGAAQFGKEKAEQLFSLKQYGRALAEYNRLLELPKETVSEDTFFGLVWSNIGACYSRMFRLDQAFRAYQTAYTMTAKPETLQSLYLLTRLDERLKLGERYETLITPQMTEEWNRRLEAEREKAGQSEKVSEIEELFLKDQVKRQAGAAALLSRWKKEYRNTV